MALVPMPSSAKLSAVLSRRFRASRESNTVDVRIVVLKGPEKPPTLVIAMAGGVQVLVDCLRGGRVKLDVADLTALAMHAEIGDTAATLPTSGKLEPVVPIDAGSLGVLDVRQSCRLERRVRELVELGCPSAPPRHLGSLMPTPCSNA